MLTCVYPSACTIATLRLPLRHPFQSHPQARHPLFRLARFALSIDQVPARGARGGERGRGVGVLEGLRGNHQGVEVQVSGCCRTYPVPSNVQVQAYSAYHCFDLMDIRSLLSRSFPRVETDMPLLASSRSSSRSLIDTMPTSSSTKVRLPLPTPFALIHREPSLISAVPPLSFLLSPNRLRSYRIVLGSRALGSDRRPGRLPRLCHLLQKGSSRRFLPSTGDSTDGGLPQLQHLDGFPCRHSTSLHHHLLHRNPLPPLPHRPHRLDPLQPSLRALRLFVYHLRP
jgi:hypothetical protein